MNSKRKSISLVDISELSHKPIETSKSGREDDIVEIIGLTGKIFSIPMKIFETVAKLKAKIEAVEGTKSGEQRLMFNGHLLSDFGSLRNKGIRNGSIIRLESEGMFIFIRPLKREVMKISVDLIDSVSSIKQKIHEMAGIPFKLQALLYRYHELKDDRTLTFYNIQKGAVLILFEKLPS